MTDALYFVLCTALYYCNMYVLCKMSGREEKQFSQRDVSVVHQVPLLHLQSGVQINIAVLLCRKYMMSQTDVSMNGLPKSHINIVSHCLKMTQNVAFEFWHFGIFHQFLSYFKK